METAQEVVSCEPEEDESVTAAVIKKALKDLIDDFTPASPIPGPPSTSSASKELELLKHKRQPSKRSKDASRA